MKFKTYIIFFLLFGVLADAYLCIFVLQSLAARVAVCIPTAVTLVCLPLIGTGRKYTDAVCVFSYVSFIFELPKTVFMLFSAVGRLMGSPSGADLVALVAGCAVSLTFITLIFYVTRHLQVNGQTLCFESLPKGFDGLRICQLSDFHLGSFGRKSLYVKRIIDRTLELHPDVIFFTGDLVNFESREVDSYMDELARLKAPMGIYAIRGNHDYLLHGPHEGASRELDTERLLGLERSLGWKVLLNSSEIIRRGSDAIAVAGVENISASPYFPSVGGDMSLALKGLPEGIFTILLSHDPSHWRSEVLPHSDVHLTLSGHTHGLKFKLAGLHVSHWRLHESSGVYTEGDRVLHVCEGLGSAFAFRLGGYPKIDIITLKTKLI